jgi:hypothetical protein
LSVDRWTDVAPCAKASSASAAVTAAPDALIAVFRERRDSGQLGGSVAYRQVHARADGRTGAAVTTTISSPATVAGAGVQTRTGSLI